MVHALKEIARVLAADGTLVEFRPLGATWPLQIVAGEQVRPAGLVDRKPDIRDDAACEQVLAQMLSEGWFVRERQETFAFFEHWGTLDQVDGPLIVPETVRTTAERLLTQMGQDARVRIRFNNVIARYRKASRHGAHGARLRADGIAGLR